MWLILQLVQGMALLLNDATCRCLGGSLQDPGYRPPLLVESLLRFAVAEQMRINFSILASKQEQRHPKFGFSLGSGWQF